MTVTAADAKRVLARRVLEQRRAQADPGFFCSFMLAPDERTAEDFDFRHLRDEAAAAASGWGWQRDLLLWMHGEGRCILLKARQLGATWVACAYAVWVAVCKPGSRILVYRQKQDESVENVIRCWRLFQSLPPHLQMGVRVLKPARGHLPNGGEVELEFSDGRSSKIVAMSSATASGHGSTAALVLMDEFSRMDNAADIMKAVQPAAGAQGKIVIVSTANGRSDEETGEGNHFHWLWSTAEESGFSTRFLPWSLHPDRDEWWYEHNPEVRGLRPHERAEQYPADEDEAFRLTNRVYFDPDDLDWYRAHRKIMPLRRGDFQVVDADRAARFAESARGSTSVFRPPDPAGTYAIGADVATGRGLDYSAAYVIDLGTMELCAEFHGRVDAALYAEQLHYLGRWYNSALIAVETAGGYGEAVIIALRDGVKGRPAYKPLYRHVLSSRHDRPEVKPYGFPTNSKTRPLITDGLRLALAERVLPGVPQGLLREMQSFIRHDSGTSPAAEQGARDDRVMACCIALEMYRLRGTHPLKRAHKKSVRRPSPQPWLEWAA